MNWDELDWDLAETHLVAGSLRSDFWRRRATRRAIREAAGLTQRRLGDHVGVDHSTVARWEDGTRMGHDEAAARYESGDRPTVGYQVC